MALYKGKYGDSGKDMVMMLFFGHKLGDGPLEVNDLGTILAYIVHNWDSVEPKAMPI